MSIFKINVPFSTASSPSPIFKPIYATSSANYPHHQLKFYALINHQLPEKLSDFPKNFPILFENKGIPLPHTDLLQEDDKELAPEQENSFIQGKLALRSKKFEQAYASFLKLSQKMHAKSIAHVLQFSCEDYFRANLAGFSPKLEEILEKLIENWKINGLFELFSAETPQTLLLQQFFVYQDLFPAFRAAVSLKSLTNPLISLFCEPSYARLQNFKAKASNFQEFGVIIADLLQPQLLGAGIYADFKEIQELYAGNLQKNARIWLRLLVSTCEFIESQREIQRIVGNVQEIDPVLARNLEIIEENVRMSPELADSCEFASYCFKQNLRKTLEISNASQKNLETLWKSLKKLLIFCEKDLFYEIFFLWKLLEASQSFEKNREFLKKIAKNSLFLEAFVEKRAEIPCESVENCVFLKISSAFLQEDDVRSEILLHSFYKLAKMLKNPQFSQCFRDILCAVSQEKPVFAAFLLAKGYKSGVFGTNTAENQQKFEKIQGFLANYLENQDFVARNLVEILVKFKLKGVKNLENEGNFKDFLRKEREIAGISKNSLEKAKEIALNALEGKKMLVNEKKSCENAEKLQFFEILQVISYSSGESFFEFVKDLLEKSLFFFEKSEISCQSAENSSINAGFLEKSAQKCYLKSHKLQYFLKNAQKTSNFLGNLLKSLEFQGFFLIKPFGFSLELHEKQGFLQLFLIYEDFGPLLSRKQALTEEFIAKIVDFLIIFEKNQVFLPFFSEKNWVFSEKGELFFADWDFFLVFCDSLLSPSDFSDFSQENADFFSPELIKSVFLDKEAFSSKKGSVYWSFGVLLFNFLAKEPFPLKIPKNLQEFQAFFNEKCLETLITQKIKEKPWWVTIKSLLNPNCKERRGISLETLAVSLRKAANVRKNSEKPRRVSAENLDNPLLSAQKLQKGKTFLRNRAVLTGNLQENCAFSEKTLSFKGKLAAGRLFQGELLDLERGFVFQGDFLNNIANFPQKGVFSRLQLEENQEFEIKNANYLAEMLDFHSFEAKLEGFQEDLRGFLQKNVEKYVNSLKFARKTPEISLKSGFELHNFSENSGFLLINRESIATKLYVFLPEVSKTLLISLEIFRVGVFLLPKSCENLNPLHISQEILEGACFSMFGTVEFGIFLKFRLIKGRVAEKSSQNFVDLTKAVFFARVSEKTQVFEGFFAGCGKQGRGIEVSLEKNQVFCGEFAKNQRSGRGFLANTQGNVLEKGLFLEGVLDFGTIYRKDAVFQGKFADFRGETCCYGSMQTSKFDVFCENEPFSVETAAFSSFRGEVRVFFKKQGWEYKGFFLNGIRKGFGVLQMKTAATSQRNSVFKGIWNDKQVFGTRFFEKNEKKLRELGKFTLFPSQKVLLNGFSRVFYANSEVFEGFVANNLRTVGSLCCENSEYFGNFLKESKEGFGIERFVQKGCEYLGFFNQGLRKKLGVWRELNEKRVIFQGISDGTEEMFGTFCVNVGKVLRFTGKCLIKLEESGVRLEPKGCGIVYLQGNLVVECEISALSPLFFDGKSFSFPEKSRDFEKKTAAKVYFPDDRVYEGEILDWEMHGVGFLKGNRGKIYEGELEKGCFEGFGKCFGDEEEIYQGFMKSGRREGVGKALLMKENKEIVGVWEKGNLVRSLCVGDGNGNKLVNFY